MQTLDERYMNRELDEKFSDIKDALDRIETQTMRTNGRVSTLEKYMLIGAAVVLTLLVTNGNELAVFLMGII